MILKRVLRYFNIGAALVLVAAVALVYWFAWRPLPKTSGSLRAPVSAPATIARDSSGVAHISAASIEDAIFLQGFVTAQDRLWQMDVLRRLSAGLLAEIMGPAALESDLAARRLRLPKLAQQQYAALPAQDRAVLAAYARGVNFFIQTHRGRLPVEFALLGYDPRPWTAVDSLLIGLHMFRVLTATWELELQKLRLLEGGDPVKVERLYPVRLGNEIAPGSNAWALAGSRTVSGKPILAGDPHLEYSLPSIWYPVHLQAPGLDVAGVALPGVPCVIIGRNRHIAWSMTNLQFDVQDLVLVRLDADSGRYVAGGQTEQARLESDAVPVRGNPSVSFNLWVTRYGPIVAREGERHYALRWAAADTAGFGFPFMEVNRAQDWRQFRAALARYIGPAQNFVYADSQGHIGYQVAGRLPIRKAHRGDLPADGASTAELWEGYIPFEHLPSFLDPPSGFVVSANQNPFPADYRYPVHGSFAPPYRAAQIRNVLTSRERWQAPDMILLQKDVYSAFHHFLAREAVRAYRKSGAPNPAAEEALEVLSRWDGQMEKDQAAPLIAVLVENHVRKAIVEAASPGKSLIYRYEMGPAVLEQLLRERPAGWFEDYDKLLVKALLDALEEGRRMQGPRVRKWSWGRNNQLLLAHPILGRLPVLGAYFRVGPVPLSGSSTTVKQTTTRIGPSMRMAVDLAEADSFFFNLPTGVSGHPLSSHFRDQWKSYYAGRYSIFSFERVSPTSKLTVLPEKD